MLRTSAPLIGALGIKEKALALLPIPSSARDVGQCIYCGATEGDLGKEHALPYGLNGPWTLLRASCAKCADVTHRFERDTLRGLLPSVRAVLAMQTRRPKERPKKLPLVLETNDIQKTIQVKCSEFPLYLPIPVFLPPTKIQPNEAGPKSIRDIDFIHIAGPSFEEIRAKYGVTFAGSRLTFSPKDFKRTLAKVAYAAAVYALGLKALDQSPIREVILSGRDLSTYVGSWGGDPVNPGKGLHEIQIKAAGTGLHAILRLFAQFQAPEYHVILGEANPEFVNSEEWPWT